MEIYVVHCIRKFIVFLSIYYWQLGSASMTFKNDTLLIASLGGYFIATLSYEYLVVQFPHYLLYSIKMTGLTIYKPKNARVWKTIPKDKVS